MHIVLSSTREPATAQARVSIRALCRTPRFTRGPATSAPSAAPAPPPQPSRRPSRGHSSCGRPRERDEEHAERSPSRDAAGRVQLAPGAEQGVQTMVLVGVWPCYS